MTVLITSEEAKLPPQVRALEDASQPLPDGVRFFEEKFGAGGMVRNFFLGLLLIAAGAVVILFAGVVMFSHDTNTVYSSSRSDYGFTIAAFGAVLAFAGYLTLSSLGPTRRLMKRQAEGHDTRYGIFLVDDLLVSHSWSDTTIIPRPFFKGLAGGAVKYDLNGAAKSFDLPKHLVGGERAALEAAIHHWAEQR